MSVGTNLQLLHGNAKTNIICVILSGKSVWTITSLHITSRHKLSMFEVLWVSDGWEFQFLKQWRFCNFLIENVNSKAEMLDRKCYFLANDCLLWQRHLSRIVGVNRRAILAQIQTKNVNVYYEQHKNIMTIFIINSW